MGQDALRELLLAKLIGAKLVTAKPRTNKLAAEIAVREIMPTIKEFYALTGESERESA